MYFQFLYLIIIQKIKLTFSKTEKRGLKYKVFLLIMESREHGI